MTLVISFYADGPKWENLVYLPAFPSGCSYFRPFKYRDKWLSQVFSDSFGRTGRSWRNRPPGRRQVPGRALELVSPPNPTGNTDALPLQRGRGALHPLLARSHVRLQGARRTQVTLGRDSGRRAGNCRNGIHVRVRPGDSWQPIRRSGFRTRRLGGTRGFPKDHSIAHPRTGEGCGLRPSTMAGETEEAR